MVGHASMHGGSYGDAPQLKVHGVRLATRAAPYNVTTAPTHG